MVGAGAELAPLKALAKKLGVTQRVRFLTDVPDADLPALYNLATAYVGLSRQAGLDVEGFGISFAEAAACGLPVIGARSGGIPDVVADGETGLLVNAEQPGRGGGRDRRSCSRMESWQAGWARRGGRGWRSSRTGTG